MRACHKFGQVAGHEFNTQKSAAFVYTMKDQKEKWRKQSHHCIKKNKDLGINLPKETRLVLWKIERYHVPGLEKSILSKWVYYWR